MVRLFWIAMLVVFAGAAVVVFTRPGDAVVVADRSPAPVRTDIPQKNASRELRQDSVLVEQETEAETQSEPEPVAEVIDREPEVVVVAGGSVGVDETTVQEPVEKFVFDSDAGAGLDALLGIDPVDEDDVDAGEESVSSGSASEEVGEARVVDEGVVLGERFEVPGEGTAQEPYVIGWDVLMSAQETYRPRQGKKDIPAWVQQIDGKYVRVDGFIVLPVMGGVMNEVLLARNEWDGCCIGVPPTAYDSVEVRLRADASQAGGQHAVNYGSIVGKMDVDPYLWKDWLISMYVMEDAVIERQGL